MKPRRFFSSSAPLLLGCSLLLMACGTPPPPTEIPITTSSEEARQLFVQGRDRLENLETYEAQKLFDQAIAKDSNFARAYLSRAGTSGESDTARMNREKAMSLIGIVSPGERIPLLRAQALAEGNAALGKAYLDSLHIKFPRDKQVKYLLGLYNRGLRDHKNALKYNEEAVGIDSFSLRARFLARTGLFDVSSLLSSRSRRSSTVPKTSHLHFAHARPAASSET